MIEIFLLFWEDDTTRIFFNSIYLFRYADLPNSNIRVLAPEQDHVCVKLRCSHSNNSLLNSACSLKIHKSSEFRFGDHFPIITTLFILGHLVYRNVKPSLSTSSLFPFDTYFILALSFVRLYSKVSRELMLYPVQYYFFACLVEIGFSSTKQAQPHKCGHRLLQK